MYLLKRAVGILLSVTFIFTNTSVYSHPENLAADSILNLWKKKGIDQKEGFIVTERLTAIHNSISQGRRTPENLRAIDIETVQRHTDTQSLRKFPFDYNLTSFRDKRIWGMIDVKIYKDKYGDKQLVLFYDPNDPPWDILEKFGVETNEQKELAKRGFWIISLDSGRRAFLAISAALLSLFATRCVFDTSGLPVTSAPDGGITPDAGPATDGGIQPINTIEQDIEITPDNSNNPVTILPTSDFTSDDTIQRLSPHPQFVRDNNAAFRYNGSDWHWELSETDRTNIINNGITYLFNGRNHKIKLIGKDNTGQTKTIVFNPQLPGTPNYTQPYRITITSAQIEELARQIGLDLETINIYFENLEPGEDFILNGFKLFYAVLAQEESVTPINISPLWTPYSSPGITLDISSTPQGTLLVNFNIPPGDSNTYSGIEIPTKYDYNASQTAVPTASSVFPGMPPSNAIDNNPGTEWAAYGDMPDLTPWIQLDWDIPKTVKSVTLRDRSNPVDNITGGQLLFSDGSTIPVGELPNDGSPLVIEFSERTVTWVRFQVISTAIGTQNPGLAEFQVTAIQDNSNFTIPEFDNLPFNVRSSTAVILQLVDNNGAELSILLTSFNSLQWRGVLSDLQDAIDITNPDFNLENVQAVRIFTTAPIVTSDDSWIELDGPVIIGGTRLEYATDDPDLTKKQRRLLEKSITKATHKKIEPEGITVPRGYEIRGVRKWPGVLTPLGFKVDGVVFSAFFIGRYIYVPHPDLLKGEIADFPLLQTTAQKRLEIILGHEIDEARGIKDHAEVVLNEFDRYSINGLNFADIATILFRSFSGTIDKTFYERFLINLFKHGTGLFLSEDTFIIIVREMINPGMDEKGLRSIYQGFTRNLDGLVNIEIGVKGLSCYAGGFDVTQERFGSEPGFAKLTAKSVPEQTRGTIPIALSRFFIKNTSLSSAVTIDTEYLKRFIAFARMLPQNVRIIGLTEEGQDNIVIGQLLAIINSQLPDGKFGIRYNADFNNYLGLIGTDNLNTSVSILDEETLDKIPENIRVQLKIVVPAKLGYNRVTDAGYEFYAAWEGLDKSRNDFIRLIHQIAAELLEHLFAAKKITREEKDAILAEIKESIRKSDGIGFIPTWYDPIQYYKTIESQKALLTAA